MTQLFWLDLETTGLMPDRGLVLEVGWILTTGDRPWLQSDWGSPRYSAVLPFRADDAHVTMDPAVREMHERSGLLAACAEKGPTGLYATELERIETQIIEGLDSPLDSPETPYLAGSSVHFDLGWLLVHMPKLAARVSYRVYDVSAVVLFCRSLGMPKPEERKDKPHRALPDLDASLALAKTCADWLASQHKSDPLEVK